MNWASSDNNTCRIHARIFFSLRNSALVFKSSILHGLGRKRKGTILQISLFPHFLFHLPGSCFLPFLSSKSLILKKFHPLILVLLWGLLFFYFFLLFPELLEMYPSPSSSSLLDFLSWTCLRYGNGSQSPKAYSLGEGWSRTFIFFILDTLDISINAVKEYVQGKCQGRGLCLGRVKALIAEIKNTHEEKNS